MHDDTEVLILGTFPSETSRKALQYYANEEKNNFWNTIAKKYNIDCFKGYKHKLDTLKQNKIGLWDIIKSCDIADSKNKTIKNEIFNDLIGFLNKHKNIRKIIINGTSNNKGTVYFVNKYLKEKNKLLTVKRVNLPMQTGQYYRTHKKEVDKMWLEELPNKNTQNNL